MTEKCIDLFYNTFGEKSGVCCFAPGRVNLIGEHTDYNGGYVFPCAIQMGIYGAAAKRQDNLLRFYSLDFSGDGIIEMPLDNIEKTGKWADYPLGVVEAFKAFGFEIKSGFEMVCCGNLPGGSGLSSSAALEMLTCAVIKNLFGIEAPAPLCAVIGQFAENRFVGVNCGIMDQFASALGKEDCAVMLNCTTLRHKNVKLPLDNTDIVIINSNVKRTLAGSAFNDRRRECETALSALGEKTGASALCDITPEKFEELKSCLSPLTEKRARHVIYENARVLSAAKVLSEGDIAAFGRLMNESHISLRDDYEVSCPELDFLTEKSREYKGVLGARLTGAGFGGCMVALVDRKATQEFLKYIKSVYKEKCAIEADAFVVSAADGARLLKQF